MSGGERSGDDEVFDLIGAIYDASLDSGLWPNVLNRLGDAVGGAEVMFGVYDPSNGFSNMLSPRTDPAVVQGAIAWAPHNPLLPLSGGEPPGRVFTCADFITLDEFTRTAFYNEWWHPAGFGVAPLTTNLLVDGAAFGVLSSFGSLDQAPFDSRQQRLFAALVKHLVRAVALQRRLYHLAMVGEDTSAGLDQLPQGVLLVDAQGRLLFVNRVAGALLDSHDGLRLRDGALSAIDTAEGQNLRRLIASCLAKAAADVGGSIKLRRALGRRPLDVLVVPVRPDMAASHMPWALPRRPAAIVLVTVPEAEHQLRIEEARRRFDFTPAETALALEIIKGDGRQAAADRLGISAGTVRSHLTSIFDKTGVRRQAELVRLLLQQ